MFGNIEMYLGNIWGVLWNIRGDLWNKRKEKVTRWRAVEVHKVQLPQTDIPLSFFWVRSTWLAYIRALYVERMIIRTL